MVSVKKPKQRLQLTFLKAWREYREMTQEEAAEKLNMSRPSISKIERAVIPYTQQLLENAAKLYGCAPQDLIMRDPRTGDVVWDVFDLIKSSSPERISEIKAVIEILLKTQK